MKECKTHSYLDNCPICALEKRVKLIELFIEGPCLTLRQARFDEQATKVNKAFGLPTVPHAEAAKLYSGFTADEWQQMLKDGPLLCAVDGGNVWIDRFHADTPNFHCGDLAFQKVSIIEQPNWRPHFGNERPVPGRVWVEIRFIPYHNNYDDFACYITVVADSVNWNKVGSAGDIYAYRIWGGHKYAP